MAEVASDTRIEPMRESLKEVTMTLALVTNARGVMRDLKLIYTMDDALADLSDNADVNMQELYNQLGEITKQLNNLEEVVLAELTRRKELTAVADTA
jgi:short-subunit dehydrogenase involved in D-alanine esterification of teichoic acids